MLAKERARLSCRIQKVLEDANIKLASVASDVLVLLCYKPNSCFAGELL
jgi:hypothetical protein